jgi:hypothetical protein
MLRKMTKDDAVWIATGFGVVAGGMIIATLTIPDAMCILMHLDKVVEELRATE